MAATSVVNPIAVGANELRLPASLAEKAAAREARARLRARLDAKAAAVRATEVAIGRLRKLVFFFSLSGLATAVLASEIYRPGDGVTPFVETRASFAAQGATTVTSFIACVLLLGVYQLEFSLLRQHGALLPSEGFLDTALAPTLALELAINGFHVPVGVHRTFLISNLGFDITYDVDSIACCIMCLRMYALVYLVDDALGYKSSQAKIIEKWNGVKFDHSFTFRACMAKAPIYTWSSAFVVFSLFYAYILRIAEGPMCASPQAIEVGWCAYGTFGVKDFSNFRVALWNVLITALTVGYGDVYAVTTVGRVVAVVVALTGIVGVALLVDAVSRAVALDDDERRALLALVRLRLRSTRELRAGSVVSAFLGVVAQKYRASTRERARARGGGGAGAGAARGDRPGEPAGGFAAAAGAAMRRATLFMGSSRDLHFAISRSREEPPTLLQRAREWLPGAPAEMRLVRAMQAWRAHMDEVAESEREKDAVRVLARNLNDLSAKVVELQLQLNRLEQGVTGELSADAPRDAGGAAGGAGGAPAPVTLRTIVEQLNALARAQGAPEAVRNVAPPPPPSAAPPQRPVENRGRSTMARMLSAAAVLRSGVGGPSPRASARRLAGPARRV